MVSCKLFSNRFLWQSFLIDPIHSSCVFFFILFTHYLVHIPALEIHHKDSRIYCNISLSVAHIKLVWDGHPSQISSWMPFNALLSSQNGSSFLSSEITLSLSLLYHHSHPAFVQTCNFQISFRLYFAWNESTAMFIFRTTLWSAMFFQSLENSLLYCPSKIYAYWLTYTY